MNTAWILKRVAQLAPTLSDCRVQDAGGGVWAFHCKRDGLARCVQFDSHGIYGQPRQWLDGSWLQGDDAIAVAIAVELGK